jgi:hypothetical protein
MSGRVHIIGETKGKQPVADYNEINVLELESAKRAKMEFWIAKKIGEKLAEVYPKRQWEVMVDLDGQMLIVKCPSLSLTHGYHIEMRLRNINELQERAIRGGGEILERHNQTRGRVRDIAVFDHLPTNLRGDVIAPDAKGGNPLKIIHH